MSSYESAMSTSRTTNGDPGGHPGTSTRRAPSTDSAIPRAETAVRACWAGGVRGPAIPRAETAGCRTVQPPDAAPETTEQRNRPHVPVRTTLTDDDLAALADPGVGPHPRPWPSDPRLDPQLLAEGDRRNVADRYRYWSVDAIRAELDTHRARLHVAIQNWEHDLNIGSVVRTANAFNVTCVHIVGRRRWNRRGAMVTDRYLHVIHHADEAGLATWCADRAIRLVGVDNLPGAVPLETATLPLDCCLVFGSEGPGLTPAMVDACEALVAITQDGSTRSLNAGAAAAIAMYHWALQHHHSRRDPA